MRDFIDTHFNVLILVGLFVGGGGVFLHVIHHSADAAALNWIEHVSDQILAALLGMMVGKTLGNGSGNGQPPSSKAIDNPSDVPRPTGPPNANLGTGVK